jgi:sarcosine oxidase subunit beta
VQLFTHNTMWRRYPLKDRYDVVIIGAGVHGLSTAYYLAKQGVTNVAVIDKGYVGGGASGRNTAIIRANYLTREGVPFFRESLKLYEDLSKELDFNLLFDQSGRLDLGHTDSAVFGLRMRTGVNRLLGVDSQMIGPSEIKKLVPAIDLRRGKNLPVMAALYQSSAGVVRHDAVVWGYGRGADRLGVEIHPFTEVTGIVREGGRVTGVDIGGQRIRADTVMSATAGWSSNIADRKSVV